jgi:predicted permease
VWVIGRFLRANPRTLAAIAMAVMFYNSGNYGLPLAELAYPGRDVGATPASPAAAADRGPAPGSTRPGEAGVAPTDARSTNGPAGARVPGGAGVAPAKDGAAVQAFVVFCQNLLTFSVGLLIAAWAGGGDLRGGVKAFLRMPTLYTIAAALLAKGWRNHTGHELPALVSATAGYLSRAFVPTALVTLGAQLAVKPRWPRWRPVSMVLVLRLAFGPVQMAALLYGLHLLRVPVLDLWPWPAESLVLTAAVPTAVNTLLLTLEVGGDADLAADCVFWTTAVSCVTITGWLVLLKTGPVFR